VGGPCKAGTHASRSQRSRVAQTGIIKSKKERTKTKKHGEKQNEREKQCGNAEVVECGSTHKRYQFKLTQKVKATHRK
jgi:hypothetical protein